ncbi:MAG: Uncharacterised protein [Cellulomonadaceae bacterium TMED98]|nr:MAG: Uncharacterised protein [Cellulomonadaceae bacterium TMED98]
MGAVAAKSNWADYAVVAHFRGVINDLDNPPDDVRALVMNPSPGLSVPYAFERAQHGLR